MADAVRIEGLADLRRDLRRADPEIRREVTRALRAGAVTVAAAAGPLAPRRSGTLASSFRPGSSGDTAFVRSRVPYAGVVEFGGTIRPKGTPIEIRPQPAVTRALALREDSIVEKVGDALDGVFARAGWR